MSSLLISGLVFSSESLSAFVPVFLSASSTRERVGGAGSRERIRGAGGNVSPPTFTSVEDVVDTHFKGNFCWSTKREEDSLKFFNCDCPRWFEGVTREGACSSVTN
jgi:hypothetical protein